MPTALLVLLIVLSVLAPLLVVIFAAGALDFARGENLAARYRAMRYVAESLWFCLLVCGGWIAAGDVFGNDLAIWIAAIPVAFLGLGSLIALNFSRPAPETWSSPG
jgi:hypothetical protein